MKKNLHYAWVNVAVCCSALFSVGCFLLTASVFMPEIANSMGISITTISLVFTIQAVAMVISTPLSAALFNRFGIRKMVSFIITLEALAICFYSFAYSIYMLIIAGILAAFSSSALIFMLAPVLVKEWFENHIEVAISIIMSFFAIGGVVFNPIATYLITKFDWRITYRILSLFISVIILPIVVFFLRDKPEDKGLKPYVNKKAKDQSKKKNIKEIGGNNITKKSSWGVLAFYLAALYVICMQFGVGMQNHLVNFSMSIGYSAAVGAIAASLCSTGGIPSKISLGFINMKIGVENSSIIYGGSGLIGLIIFYFFGSMSKAAIYIGALLFGFWLQSTLVQIPTLCYRLFGKSKNYSSIYGNIILIGGSLSTGSNILLGYLYDKHGTYNIGLIILICLLIISVILANILLRKNVK